MYLCVINHIYTRMDNGYTSTDLCTFVHTCIHLYKHTYIYLHITYTHTYVCIHTYCIRTLR